METFSIDGVEVFSAGKWNGDEYTVEDLTGMVNAFNETKTGIPPFLKLGHDNNQELLQKDGLPAAGWITNLYVKGNKLLANFSDIPKQIFKLIQTKAYKKVSSEIFWNISVGGKKYPRLLGAVALLGADTPGVYNLNDILSMYKNIASEPPRIYNEFSLEIKQIEVNNEIDRSKQMELEQKVSALEAEVKKFSANIEEKDASLKQKDQEIEALKAYKKESEAKEAKLLLEAETAKNEQFVSELITEKLCSPAMKPYIAELLGEEKKEYSIKLNDKESKLDKKGLIKEALKLFKASADVNFEESSSNAKDKSQNKTDDETIDKLANEYMTKHQVNYSVAVKAVLAEQKQK